MSSGFSALAVSTGWTASTEDASGEGLSSVPLTTPLTTNTNATTATSPTAPTAATAPTIIPVLLFGGAVTYTVWLIRESRKRRTPQQRPNGAGADLPPRSHRRTWPVDVGLVLIGLTLLTLGAGWLVGGAVALARTLGISELIVGLTVVAVGTSLPELATSVVAAARGERDIAVGNVVGSNIFNVLTVLGLTAAVAPDGVKVTHTALVFDIPVMVVVALACLPIFFTGYRVDRWEGLLFLGYYVAYVVYLALDATRSGALAWYRMGMLGFALPLTAYVLTVSVLHGLRRRST